MEPQRGRVGEMGRGGNEGGEGLFMSRNAEDSEIGLGFSREAGGASPCSWSEAGAVSGMSPGGSSSAHGINPLYLGYPENSGRIWDPQSTLPSCVSPRGSHLATQVWLFPKIPVKHRRLGAFGSFIFQLKSQSWFYFWVLCSHHRDLYRLIHKVQKNPK